MHSATCDPLFAPVAVDGVRMIDHALAYARRGWPVFPCWERDETDAEFQARQAAMPRERRKMAKRWEAKNPRVAGGFKAATANEAKIRSWWARWPQATIGCPTGPGIGCWVLDVDLAKAPGKQDGRETLARLEATHGPLPGTLTQRTGSGGEQRFFLWPAGGQEIRNTNGKLGPCHLILTGSLFERSPTPTAIPGLWRRMCATSWGMRTPR